MKLEINHITPYLPYGLKCQYQGVTNLKEIREYNKTKPKDDMWNLGFDWETNKPKAIIGNRIGVIKEIKFYKEYTTIHFGNYHRYLKTLFFEDIKPILRPLSDLTKEIEIDGEKFVPAIKLAEINIANGGQRDIAPTIEFNAKITNKPFGKLLKVTKCDTWYLMISFNNTERIKHFLFIKLLEWHFDVFGLIPEGLAIDINEQ